MSTHLCTFSRATPGTDPAPTPATGPQPLSAITLCVKYEPSSSVGCIMLCSQILSQNSIDFMKNIGEKYFQTCFWPKPCTEPVLVLCCVCVKTCAVGQKCCVPCVASLLLLGGNVSVDQGRTQQSSTESSCSISWQSPSRLMSWSPSLPVRLDHFITHPHCHSPHCHHIIRKTGTHIKNVFLDVIVNNRIRGRRFLVSWY